MSLERKDNIGDTSTTTGTGTLNLEAVAQTGARIFAGNVTSGATVHYDIRLADGSEWEIGEGVFTDGTPDTLTRVTVYASSNAGSLVSFSAGTKNVSLVFSVADVFGENSVVANETPAGTLNGSNVTFTLANSPITNSLALYLNGQRLTYTDDYTLSANTITFVVPPVSTDIIRADYLIASSISGNADTLDGHNWSEIPITPASASAPASIDLAEDTDNGTNKITITAPSAIASNKVLTLPDVSGMIALVDMINPIGTIREFNVATNPATLLGFGTWSAFGTGRVTVAIDAGQAEFDTNGETGGAKTHTLVAGEVPNIAINAYANTGGALSGGYFPYDSDRSGNAYTTIGGSGGAHNNLQPYIVVYRWVITA